MNFYGTPVTVTITARKPTFEVGGLIRIAKKKRWWGEITKTDGYTELSIKAIYRPAPKSQLLTKSKFSKFKNKIIPLTTN